MYFSRAVSRSVTAVGRRFGRSLSATAFQPAVSPKIRVAAGVAGMSMAVCSAVRMSLLALLFYIFLHLCNNTAMQRATTRTSCLGETHVNDGNLYCMAALYTAPL